MDSRHSLNRRQFLAASTVGATALLAGCGSSSGKNKNNSSTKTETETTPPITTTSGPAQFARVSFTGPSKVTVDEPFRLTLEATNVGGQTGKFTDTIHVREGASTLSVPISSKPVAPKESISVQTPPIQLSRADTYVFGLGITEITHSTAVNPKTGDLGATFDLSDSLRASVTDISFQSSVFYDVETDEGTTTHLRSPPSGSLLAILRVSLENTGTKSTTILGDGFHLANGQIYPSQMNIDFLSTAQISGKPFTTLKLAPAEQRERWLLGHVPRSEARKSLTINYQRDTGGTPPEFQWIANPQGSKRTLPQFSIKSFQLPNSTEVGTDVSSTVAITNTGKKTATFRGMVEYRHGNSGDWQPLQPLKARIRPGKTTHKQFTINSNVAGKVTYRIAPLGTTKTITFTPPVLPLGKTYTTTENVEVTVSDLQSATVVKSHALAMDPVSRVTPSSGKRLVVVKIRATVVGDSEGMPFTTEFTMRDGSQTFEKVDGVREVLIAPVEGRSYDGYYDPDEGEIQEGYLVWSVPKRVSLADLTVQWQSQEPSTGAEGETVRWTKGGKIRSN